MSIYEYHPHPYIRERAKRGPVRVEDQHKTSGLLGRFNKRVGVLITVIVGTMWCAYLFTALALISLPAAIKTGDRIVIVAWIAQTFLQLVLLPDHHRRPERPSTSSRQALRTDVQGCGGGTA